MEIVNPDVPTVVEAFRRGLPIDSELYRELTKYDHPTFEDVQMKALAYARLEEDLTYTTQMGQRSKEQSRRLNDDKRQERPKPYFRPNYEPKRANAVSRWNEPRRANIVNRWIDDPNLPPKVSAYCFSVGVPGLIYKLQQMGEKVKWPRKNDDPTRRKDPTKFCEFHNDVGHLTEDCIALRKEVAHLLRNGHLNDILTEKAKTTVGQTGKDAKGPPRSPEPVRNVNFIMGGSDVCGLTYSAAKRHAKESKDAVGTVASVSKATEAWRNAPLTFDGREDDAERHHDGLVVTISIGNCRVRRVLIDNGSTANVVSTKTLKEMGLNEDAVARKLTTLIGFSGEAKETAGIVYLPVYAKGINLQMRFDVVNELPAYNVILGTPWIHQMRAVPSTFHQTVKFPTPWGIQEIKGDQKLAKECYRDSFKSVRKTA